MRSGKTVVATRSWVEKRRKKLLDGLRRERDPLVAFLAECKEDMHEPDEQDVSAKVVGDGLNNAFGNSGECQEMVVVFRKGKKEYRVNLATLIALARKAVV